MQSSQNPSPSSAEGTQPQRVVRRDLQPLDALLKPQLHRNRVTRVYETMERPLVPVLAEMEMAGVQVDRDTLSRMSNAFSQKMAALEASNAEVSATTTTFTAQ